MTDLPALIDGGELEAQVGRLIAARQWVVSAAGEEAVTAAFQAKVAREWLKAINGAANLATEATRLEMVAMRRIGQLGAEDLLGRGDGRRAAARSFAAMDDAEFASILDRVPEWATAVGVHRAHQRDAQAHSARDRGRSMASGRTGHATGGDLRELAQAAGALLNDYTSAGRPFSIAEAAERIANDFNPTWWEEAPAREGLMEVVRQAVASDNAAGGAPGDAPSWITYHEDELGWVRIPWSVASLAQLEAMVQLRHGQLAELRAACERLDGVLASAKAAHAARPSEFSLAQLLNDHGPEELAS